MLEKIKPTRAKMSTSLVDVLLEESFTLAQENLLLKAKQSNSSDFTTAVEVLFACFLAYDASKLKVASGNLCHDAVRLKEFRLI